MEKWEALKLALQQEISLLREILSNMLQEEAVLLLNNLEIHHETLLQRSYMISSLQQIRLLRKAAIDLIEKDTQTSLLELLEKNDDASTDIIYMRDQLFALVEKLNTQNHRNQLLIQQGGAHRAAQAPQLQKKKKSAIATYPTEEVN